MRLHEINGSVNVDQVINDCMPYLREVNFDTSCIPLRDMGRGVWDGEGIHYYKTRESRSSFMLGPNTPITDMIDRYMDEEGHALRYKNALFTSSKGSNTMFDLKEADTAYVLPKDDFRFSYYPNDFNDIDFSYVSYNLKRFIQDIKMETSINVGDMLQQYSPTFESLESVLHGIVDDIATNHDIGVKALNQEIADIMSPVKTVLSDLRNIRSDNLVEAFSMENEIWFNCEGYYAISRDGVDELLVQIEELR